MLNQEIPLNTLWRFFMYLSDLYGKKVISLNTANVFGTVCGVHINKTTYAPDFISLSPDGDIILATADMYGYGDVVSTFAEPRELSDDDRKTTFYLAIGAEAFDAKGKSLGNVTDYTFNGNKRSKRIIINDLSIHPQKLVAANGVLVFNTGRQLPPKKKPAIQSAEPVAETTETVVNTPAPSAPEVYSAPVEPVPEPQPQFFSERPNTATISPETLNFDFLLGRTTKRNISDLNGLLLIPIGTIISRHIIDSARKNGKLSELAISSR